jgi:hypothetical protein
MQRLRFGRAEARELGLRRVQLVERSGCVEFIFRDRVGHFVAEQVNRSFLVVSTALVVGPNSGVEK